MGNYNGDSEMALDIGMDGNVCRADRVYVCGYHPAGLLL